MAERSPLRCRAAPSAHLATTREPWRLARLQLWIACAALACASRPPLLDELLRPAPPGSVQGRLLPPPDGRAPTSEPMVVFLEPLDAPGAPPTPPLRPLLRLDERGLAPAVLAVAAGDSVRLVNDTGIYHRLFSTSESNPFDLGVLRRGETRSIELPTPGVVRIYCSLHPSERAVVFIAPSPYFATFRPPAAYEIRDVPPGRYRLHGWSESAPATSRAVTVRSGATVAAELASAPAAAE